MNFTRVSIIKNCAYGMILKRGVKKKTRIEQSALRISINLEVDFQNDLAYWLRKIVSKNRKGKLFEGLFELIVSPKNLMVAWIELKANTSGPPLEIDNRVFHKNLSEIIIRVYQKLRQNDYRYRPLRVLKLSRPEKISSLLTISPVLGKIL